MRYFLVLYVHLLLFFPPLEASSSPEKISEGIAHIIHSVDPNVHIGIEVVSLTTGEQLYAQHANHLFLPASNMKLITAAAALQLLGSQFRFHTKLYTDGTVEEGVLRGDLYIQGSGDPQLTTASLEELVLQLKLQGIHHITGNLYVDHSAFDTLAQGPGCTWDDGAVIWNAPVDALMIDHGCVRVEVTPNAQCDLPPHAHFFPKTDLIRIENRAVTSLESKGLQVERRWRTKENCIEVTGSISPDEKVPTFFVAVQNPHLHTAGVFRSLLTQHGITCIGDIEEKTASPHALEIGCYSSSPLAAILIDMMKNSDNLIADCLFKKMGQTLLGSPGTWASGTQAVQSFLTDHVGIDVANMVICDGSGLSRYNLLPPHQLVQLLTWVDQHCTVFAPFLNSLPIGGVDGALRYRMNEPSIQGKVRAKTGVLMGVSALSGYITTQRGEKLAFSIMLNGFTRPSSEYKTQIEDQIVQLLAQHSKE